jgi:hypothetical protein
MYMIVDMIKKSLYLRCRISPSLSLKDDPSPDPHDSEVGAGNLIPVPIH